MEKDFDRWNEQQKILDATNKKFSFKEGEVWWCFVGMNIGSESYGKGETFSRPVLVMRKLSHESFIGIPLSTKPKQGAWFMDISISVGIRTLLLYQIRMFSTKRFNRHLATLSASEFSRVKEKLKRLLELS